MDYKKHAFKEKIEDSISKEMDSLKKAAPGRDIIRDTFYASLLVFVLSSLTGSVGSLIDGVIIGQCMGVDSIAAFGLISPLMFVFVLFGAIISAGSRNRFTRLIGEGRIDDARGVFTLSCVLSVGLAVLCMIAIIVFSEQISIFLGASGNAANLLEKAKAYLIGVSIGLPAMNGIRILSAYMVIDSDKNRPVIATIIMTVINILLDLVVAFVIHGETFEMGLTTSIGYYVSFAVLLMHFTKKDILLKFNLKAVKWNECYNIVKTGLPTGICRISNTVRSSLLNNMLAVVATSGAIAAYTVHRSADGFLNPITIGMADTVALIAGVLMGEQDRPRIKKLLKTSLNATIIFTLAISVIAFIMARPFAALYIKNDPEALVYATKAVQCYAVGMPFYGLNLIYQNYMQGIGKSTISSISGALMEGVFLVITALIMLPFFKQEAIWLAFPVTQLVMLIFYVIVIQVYKCKNQLVKPTLGDRILLLPEAFDSSREPKIDRTIMTMDEVNELSREAWDFCTEQGCDQTRRYVISLAIEELGCNIIQHGFKGNGIYSIDVRVIKKQDDYIIRMRDNCPLFDPKKQLELFSKEDLTKHMGLRMAFSMAKDIQYTSILKLNNLVIKM